MLKILQTFLSYYIVYALAFDEIYVYGDASQDMLEKGRTQYQQLRERGNLPKYGNCWKSAVEHLEEGCRNLSEETQSDIALHITNCFLEQSGHDTYNCELNKKPNLRGICINSMSDRAFNVYTEFYTHTQNMCWFLRGQIWQETMAENTLKVGKQLEASARNQEHLLRTQQESLEIQEKMVEHGKFLGKVMEDLYISSQIHREMLHSLQSWLIGEISWFNTVVFYVSASLLMLIFTSTKHTASSRLPILCLLFLNCVVERMICSLWVSYGSYLETLNLYNNINDSIWICRYFFIAVCFLLLFLRAYYFRDITIENNKLLEKIDDQTCKILNILDKSCTNYSNQKLSLINENCSYNFSNGTNNHTNGVTKIEKCSYSIYKNRSSDISAPVRGSVSPNIDLESSNKVNNIDLKYKNNLLSNGVKSLDDDKSKENSYSYKYGRVTPRPKLNPLGELQVDSSRYNLRTRSVTPDVK